MHLEGTVTLDGVPVMVVADVELGSMSGWGHLVLVEPGPTLIEV